MTKKNKKADRTQSRKSQFIWYIHIFIFAIVQLVFFIFDGDIGRDWDINGLNSIGEWVVFNNPLREWVQIHKSQPLNGVTATWGIVLLIHGALVICHIIWPEKEKITTESSNK